MNFSRRRRLAALPLDVVASQVDALYQDPKTFLAGSFGTIAAGAYVALANWNSALMLCVGAIALVSMARFGCMLWYAASRPRLAKRAQFEIWKWRYITFAAAHVALLSAFPALVFAMTDDHAARLLSFAVAVGYMAGISGRNFSSAALVAYQIVGSIIPLCLAILIAGTEYYVIIPLAILPFFVGVFSISTRLRSLLTALVLSERGAHQVAARFDAALNNMPHGLMMFDARGRLAVVNRQCAGILGTALKLGQPAQEVLGTARPSDTASAADVSRLAEAFAARLTKAPSLPIVTELLNNLVLKIGFQAMDRGGAVVLVEDVTEQKKAEHAIRTLAAFDSLTGLPNRTHFLEEFARVLACRHAQRHALLFIDLDEFKQVNDTLGHAIGDDLLRVIARRLRDVAGEARLMSRLGGDEFVVLVQDIAQVSEAQALADRLIECIKRPVELSGQTLRIRASIGISVAPEHGDDATALLKRADMALYSAKTTGKGVSAQFDVAMEARSLARAILESDLRSALHNNEFSLAFQPQYDLSSGRISTFEALLRWRHPQRGFVSPVEFIPVAEEMGLITEIGAWVLAQACAEAAAWPAHIGIAVNISPVQFERSNILGAVEKALSTTGLSPHRLELEITETALISDDSNIATSLQCLRRQGIRIALDDFGTGYSSLSHLSRFTIDKLKIDRSFVQGIETDAHSRALLHGITRMCGDIGLIIVVEGVETVEQLQAITEENTVHEIQGYLFSRPVDAAQARALARIAPSTPDLRAAS